MSEERIEATLSPNDSLQGAADQIRLRILHVLEIFPFISNSMIHMAIGTSTPTMLWKPILAQLVNEGIVVEHTITTKSALERNQVYTIYHLPENEYIYGPKGPALI